MSLKQIRNIFIILFFFVLNIQTSIGKEFTAGFILEMYATKVKVTAPPKFENKTSIIIKNMTLSNLLGKIQTLKGRLISFVNIPANKFDSVILNRTKGERVVFIPLSPAFEAIELIDGKESYEIPPNLNIK